MKVVREAARDIPVMAETDVLVVGSGPGGLAAALASARENVSTILVERYGCFGGNITQAMVESIAWYRHEGTVESEGIGVEFERRAKELGGSRKEPQSLSEALDADMFKVVADRMVEESGVVPILHCFAVEPVMEGPCIKGVVTESKSGRQCILAKRVIDASGDGDIAVRGGAPYRMDPKEDLQGLTVSFGCSGVDRERFLEYVTNHPAKIGDWATETSGKEDDLFSTYLGEPFRKAREAGEIPANVLKCGFWSSLTEAGEATYLNMVYMRGKDPTSVWDLTRAEIEGRQQALWAIAALKKYAPGFEKAKLRTFGSSVGVRESRKVIGEYILTGDDVRNEARFEDSVGIFPEFLDIFNMAIIPTTGRYFHVPYRILVPLKVENLLVAGRCVAGDKASHAGTRQMMCCTVTGQAAGVAAAVSVKGDVTCRRVNVGNVQKALKNQGVRIV
jgi:hypothetical protein